MFHLPMDFDFPSPSPPPSHLPRDIDLEGEQAGDPTDDENDGRVDSEMKRLMDAWVGERCAPGILKWEDELVDGLMWRVEQQVSPFCTLLDLPIRYLQGSRLEVERDGVHVTLGRFHERGRTLQADARPDGDGTSQVSDPILLANQAGQSLSLSPW